MKTAHDLTREQLEKIVDTVQRSLWEGDADIFDPDTEWNWERVEQIADALTDAGLRPDEEETCPHDHLPCEVPRCAVCPVGPAQRETPS
jgi:hypothetical protein